MTEAKEENNTVMKQGPRTALQTQINSIQFIKAFCCNQALKAYQTQIEGKKITQKVFKKLFGFQRRNTTAQQITNISKFNSTFFKKYEQRVLRKFFELGGFRGNFTRKVKKDEMWFHHFQQKLVHFIEDDEIKKVLVRMQDLSTFLSTVFDEMFNVHQNIQMESTKKRLIVECYLYLRIKNILSNQIDKRQKNQQQNMIREVLRPPVCNYGCKNDESIYDFWRQQQNDDEVCLPHPDSQNNGSLAACYQIQMLDYPKEQFNCFKIPDFRSQDLFADISVDGVKQNNQ